MSVSFVHSNAFHRHFFRFVAGIVLVDQLFPSVNPHPGGKSPILEALFMSVSAAGNHFQQKQPGGFILQTNGHSAVKCRSRKGDHRLGIIVQDCILLHLDFNGTKSRALVHFMDFLKGLGQNFQVRPFLHMIGKFLGIPCHNSRRRTKGHDLNTVVFFLKGHHDLVWGGKG